jgi:hypothetical protein
VTAGSRRTELLRRHWPFLAVLALGFALRVVSQVAYRPALLYVDSYSYLGFLHSLDPTTVGQTVGYDFLLLAPVLAVGNLFAVVAVQHLLGLGIGVAIYVLVNRYGVSRWLAAAATVPILLDAYQIQIEQNIMSETLFEALLAAGTLVLLWNLRPSRRALVAGALLLGLAVPVRVVAAPLIVPLVGFALLLGAGWRDRLRRAALVGVAFLLPVIGYMTYYFTQSGQFMLTNADASSQYGRAAQIADCATLRLPDYERKLCPPQPLGHRLGVDYYANVYPVTDLVTVPPDMTIKDVLRDFSRRVFRQQPLDLARAAVADFFKGFRPTKADAPGDVPVFRWQFQTVWPVNPTYDPVAATRDWGGGPPTLVRPLAGFLRGYQRSAGYTPGTVLLVALVAGGLAACGVGHARRSGLRLACGFVALSCVVVLFSASLYLFSWRYQLPALVLAPIAGALGLTALIRRSGSTFPADNAG